MADLTDIRGTAFVTFAPPAHRMIDSTSVDEPGRIEAHPNLTRAWSLSPAPSQTEDNNEPAPVRLMATPTRHPRHSTTLCRTVTEDPVLYAHASRVFHKETNPHNALPLIQAHGDREV